MATTKKNNIFENDNALNVNLTYPKGKSSKNKKNGKMSNTTFITDEQMEVTIDGIGNNASANSNISQERDNWVQCDHCEKWRRLPAYVNMDTLPKEWYCKLNKDTNYNSCDIPEEVVPYIYHSSYNSNGNGNFSFETNNTAMVSSVNSSYSISNFDKSREEQFQLKQPQVMYNQEIINPTNYINNNNNNTNSNENHNSNNNNNADDNNIEVTAIQPLINMDKNLNMFQPTSRFYINKQMNFPNVCVNESVLNGTTKDENTKKGGNANNCRKKKKQAETEENNKSINKKKNGRNYNSMKKGENDTFEPNENTYTMLFQNLQHQASLPNLNTYNLLTNQFLPLSQQNNNTYPANIQPLFYSHSLNAPKDTTQHYLDVSSFHYDTGVDNKRDINKNNGIKNDDSFNKYTNVNLFSDTGNFHTHTTISNREFYFQPMQNMCTATNTTMTTSPDPMIIKNLKKKKKNYNNSNNNNNNRLMKNEKENQEQPFTEWNRNIDFPNKNSICYNGETFSDNALKNQTKKKKREKERNERSRNQ